MSIDITLFSLFNLLLKSIEQLTLFKEKDKKQ